MFGDEEDILDVPLNVYNQPRQVTPGAPIEKVSEDKMEIPKPIDKVKPIINKPEPVSKNINQDDLLFDDDDTLDDKPKINVDKDSIIVNDNSSVITDDEFFDDFFDKE